MSEHVPSKKVSIQLPARSGDELELVHDDDGDLYVCITDEDRCTSMYIEPAHAVRARDFLNAAYPAHEPPVIHPLQIFAEWAAGARCDDTYAPRMVRHIAALATDALAGKVGDPYSPPPPGALHSGQKIHAQHDETGRWWRGPRGALPKGYTECPAPPVTRMRITYQLQGRCFWHDDCEKSRSGIMRVLGEEPERSLLECLHCGLQGYYPVGGVGAVCVDIMPASRPTKGAG